MGSVRTRRVLQRVILLGLVLVWPGMAYGANLFSEAWTRFDHWVYSFDPAGDAAKYTLERAIPGLDVRGGLVQQTDIRLQGDKRYKIINPNGSVTTTRVMDWRFQQIQWLPSLELRYHPPGLTTQLEFVVRGEGLYDAVYDWDDSRNLFAGSKFFLCTNPKKCAPVTGPAGRRFKHLVSNADSRRYKEFRRNLREATMEWYPSDQWRFKVGKQQTVWGKLISPITDVIDNFDVREGPQFEGDDFEQRRISNWGLDMSYYWYGLGAAHEFNAVWLWDYQGVRHAGPFGTVGSPWAAPFALPLPPFLKTPRDAKPGFDPEDHSAAFRWNWNFTNLTFSLGYAYLWNGTPNLFLRRVGRQFPVLVTKWNRLHRILTSFDYGFDLPFPWVPGEVIPVAARGEFDYAFSNLVTDNSLGPKVARGIRDDNQVHRDFWRLGFDFTFSLPNRTQFTVIPLLFWNQDWKNTLVGGATGGTGNEWDFTLVNAIVQPWRFTEDRLTTTLFFFNTWGGPKTYNYEGMKIRLVNDYRLSLFLRLRLIATFFELGHFGTTRDLRRHRQVPGAFDQFEYFDNIGWEVIYSF